MIFLELLIVLGAVFLGARLGGIAIGLTGALGTILLAVVCGLKPGAIPVDVILIIISVIMPIAAMQLAGGIDYLVSVVEKVLRKHPQQITIFAPIVTYCMTLLAGTGHTAFSSLPVIAEVAKEQGIRPSRPLSIAVVASQIAITASPISAAVIAFSNIIQPFNVSYLQVLMITIPTTFIACILTAFICNHLGCELKDDPVYQERVQKGLVKLRGSTTYTILPYARRSFIIFALSVLLVTIYAVLISPSIGLMPNPPLKRDEAIMLFMLVAALCIIVFCKANPLELTNMPTFKSGMSAAVCVLGVAWMGDTFVKAHIADIQLVATDILAKYPWLLSVALFFAAMLLYSQAATTKALMPSVLVMGHALVSPTTAVASFCAVSALFVLPTYPTLLAAVEMDDTGSTRIGKYVFNHSFFIPGTLAIVFGVILGFLFAPLIL